MRHLRREDKEKFEIGIEQRDRIDETNQKRNPNTKQHFEKKQNVGSFSKSNSSFPQVSFCCAGCCWGDGDGSGQRGEEVDESQLADEGMSMPIWFSLFQHA